MQKITAVIPAKNEEKQIARCLESLAWCDSVIVIFSGNDRTGEIAKDHGVKVIVKANTSENDFQALQKNINWVIDNEKTDWILRVDADEVVTPELKDEILSVLKNDDKNVVGYGIPRKHLFLGNFLKGGDWVYDRLVRLFRPKYCRYEPIVKVHEQLKVNGKIGYLKNKFIHYSHPDMETLMKKFDTYTTLEADALTISRGDAFLKMLFNPVYIFLRWFFYHHGYRDGLTGFRAGMLRGYYDFLVYSKYLLNG